MLLRKFLISLGVTLIALSFTSCRKPSPKPPQNNTNSSTPLNLSGKSEIYKLGVSDGCSTARSTYKKDHNAFNTNVEYHNGWFDGRMSCEITQAKRPARMLR